MTIRAGLIGTGQIAKFHVQALRRLADVEIVGVVDRDAARAAAFANAMSVPVYPSLASLRSAGAQVIHVLTPPSSHADIAVEAIELGCDVFVEKPLATSAEDCERIERAAVGHGRSVCAGHSLLYDPFVRQALALVRDGAIGDVVDFDYYRSMPPHMAAAGPSAEHSRGGYPFRDIGIHALYLAEAFVGAIEHADAWPMASGRGNCNLWVDEWRVLARCARGTAQLHLSWNVRPQQNLLIVQGTRGIIRADLFGLSVTTKRSRPLPEHATRIANTLAEAHGAATQALVNVSRVVRGRLLQFHGLQMLVAEFYRCLAAGEPSPVPAGSAQRVIRWTEAIAGQGDAIRDEWVAATTKHRCGATTLVTGGSGYIGQQLVRRLLNEGTAVRLLVRRPPAADIATHPRVELVLGDLGDPPVVAAAMDGVRTVYHLGAAMRGSAAEFDIATIRGTSLIVDECLRRDARLIYMSSLAVVDTDAGRDGRPVVEDVALEQRTAERGHYTRAKLEAERIVVKAVGTRGLRAVLLRPGEVVGAGKPLLTPGVAQKVGRTLIVLGNGRARLPLVHVEDVVDGLIAAAAGGVPNGALIHLVDPACVTQNDVIADYRRSHPARVVRIPLPAVTLLARAAEALATRLLGRAPIGPRRIRAATSSRVYDCTLAQRLLGWAPRAGVASVFTPAATRVEPVAGPAAGAAIDPAAV